jgi:hypothetical protein
LKLWEEEGDMKRYRIRTKKYLCLSPEEAVTTGITLGEQTIEELSLVSLVQNPGFGYHEYAALRKEPEKVLLKMPVNERLELSFENRAEAVRFVKGHTDTHELCGVTETRIVKREELHLEEPGLAGPGGLMDELKMFDRKPKK